MAQVSVSGLFLTGEKSVQFLQELIETAEEESTVQEIPKEYGIDFDTGQLTGTIVEGLEAVKVWIWLCLHTERFKYPIYTWDYGWDAEQYIGYAYPQEYIETTCEQEITDAMLVNPWITAVSDFSVEMDGALLKVSFTAETDFGDVEVSDGTVL